jgi:hypothetical protein
MHSNFHSYECMYYIPVIQHASPQNQKTGTIIACHRTATLQKTVIEPLMKVLSSLLLYLATNGIVVIFSLYFELLQVFTHLTLYIFNTVIFPWT